MKNPYDIEIRGVVRSNDGLQAHYVASDPKASYEVYDEFAKSLFSLPVICMQNSTGTYPRARDPHRRPRRPSSTGCAGTGTAPADPGTIFPRCPTLLERWKM